MDVRIYASRPYGRLTAMASKSDVHRALICAAFSDRETFVRSNAVSKDMEATAGCLRAAGARINYDEDRGGFSVIPVTGSANCDAKMALGHGSFMEEGKLEQTSIIEADCGESGSTLRFLIPVFSAAGIAARYVGRGRLPERPLSAILDELKDHGMAIRGDKLPLEIRGQLKAGSYRLPGNESSQFISGMLMALPLMAEPRDSAVEGNGQRPVDAAVDGNTQGHEDAGAGGTASRLFLTTKLSSSAYVDMTIDTMRRFGVNIGFSETETGFFSYEGQGTGYVSPGVYEADGDWSNAAFFLAADRLMGGGHIKIDGLRRDSVQGDRQIEALLEGICSGSGRLMDASEIPDLVPIAAVAMALSRGSYEIINAGRLRIKESDRLSAACQDLSRLGATVAEEPEGLRIVGSGGVLRGGVELSSFNDHRIAMAMSVAALFCEEPVIIKGAECVDKSFPGFFKELQRLHARLEIMH